MLLSNSGDGAAYIAERWPEKTPRFGFACSVTSFGCQRSQLSSAKFGCSMFPRVFHFYKECYGRQSRDDTSESDMGDPGACRRLSPSTLAISAA